LDLYELDSGISGPTRLFVGGVHGREGKITGPILRDLAKEGSPAKGRAIIVPAICENKKHISTLREKYYHTREGRSLLSIIKQHKPDIYVEAHCYRQSAYEALTDPERKKKKGVPPLIELEKGTLIGSVSPFLLSRFAFETSILLEVPCRSLESRKVVLELLKVALNFGNRDEIFGEYRRRYPKQIGEAVGLFYAWFSGKTWPHRFILSEPFSNSKP